MKRIFTKPSLILTFVMLFVAALNVSSQVKETQTNPEKNQELKSVKTAKNISSFGENKTINKINLEKEKFQDKYSPLKTFSENKRANITQSILAAPSDSAYIYDWVDDDWLLDIRVLYYSNASGVEIIEEKKVEGTDGWERQNKSEYLYYQSNNLQRLTNSFWKSATQEWVIDEVEAYNEAGMETEYYYKVWNDTTQKFVDGIRIISDYENDTNLVEDVLQVWDTINNSWAFALMIENEFNSNGLITSSVEKIYNEESSEWENSYYMMYEYDLGEPVGETWQYWDTISGEWMNDVKVARSYNEIGDLTEQTVQVWDTTASEWENNNKRIIDYNDFFQLEMINNQIWNTDSETWIDTTKFTYSYTELGDISTYIEEVWNGNSWESDFRETYTYDANNNLTDIVLEVWDSENDEWDNYAVIYYTYDASEGFLKSRQDDYWNPNTNSWEIEFYAELGVIANALDFVEYYDKDWNDTLYKFTGGFREIYEYYDNGQTKEIVVYEWDTENSQWVRDQKINYYWSAALSAEFDELGQISIYPTPFNNTLNIELNENINSIEIELYNIQGQEIERFYLDKKVSSVDLSRLKNGVYFIVYEAEKQAVC